MAEIAHAHGLPMIVDAASTLPPVGHITRWTETGADLVILSGGKGIRGPQNTGLWWGAGDLIRAAAANGSPNSAVGRPCSGQQGSGSSAWWPPSSCSSRMITRPSGRVTWRRRTDPQGDRRNPRDARALEEDRTIWTAPTILLAIDRAVTGLNPDSVMEAPAGRAAPSWCCVHRGDSRWSTLTACGGDEASVVARRLGEELLRRPVRPLTPAGLSMPRPLFATTVIGSLPRPAWIRDVILDRKAGRLGEAGGRSTPDAAIDGAIRAPGAGRRRRRSPTASGAARATSTVSPTASGGFRPDINPSGGLPTRRSWRRSSTTGDRGPEMRYVRARTSRRVKATLPAPYHHRPPDVAPRALAGRVLRSASSSCATASASLRREIEAVRAAGADTVQLDEPWLATPGRSEVPRRGWDRGRPLRDGPLRGPPERDARRPDGDRDRPSTSVMPTSRASTRPRALRPHHAGARPSPRRDRSRLELGHAWRRRLRVAGRLPRLGAAARPRLHRPPRSPRRERRRRRVAEWTRRAATWTRERIVLHPTAASPLSPEPRWTSTRRTRSSRS